jgi:hypothetical protein
LFQILLVLYLFHHIESFPLYIYRICSFESKSVDWHRSSFYEQRLKLCRCVPE